MTTSGRAATICAQTCSMYSSSILNRVFQSSSFVISTLAFESPFLYSRGQSKSNTLGLTIFRRMRGCVTSLLNMTPLNTLESAGSPPGTFSTFAYLLMSTSFTVPSPVEEPLSWTTRSVAWTAISMTRSPQRLENLVPIQDCTSANNASLSLRSTVLLMEAKAPSAASKARAYPRQIIVGWMFLCNNGSATCNISPVSTITEVVPSPTSSSCARESSIICLAAGWETSTSLKIALASFVMTMPPMGSRSILSIARGPNVLRTMPATAWAAPMFASWALRPVSLWVFWLRTSILATCF
mmetsp:Transcript_3214/g.7835  ORF Transcript_3214/g.7835 Transcript_3214/m.7835 type:complete len:297 (+) Transcript_3214:776-1666(+)